MESFVSPGVKMGIGISGSMMPFQICRPESIHIKLWVEPFMKEVSYMSAEWQIII